jgi:uncharacterized integral membrane protein
VTNPDGPGQSADQIQTNGRDDADADKTGAALTRNRRRAHTDAARHTRISGAWVAVAVAVVLGAALVDFIVQNTRSVRIEFFAASGRMPVAVALLGAALAGAFLVLAVGIARTTQLRLANRRGKKLQQQTESLVTGSPN